MRNLTQNLILKRTLVPSLSLWLGMGVLASACGEEADGDDVMNVDNGDDNGDNGDDGDDGVGDSRLRGGPIDKCDDIDTGFPGDDLCLAKSDDPNQEFMVLHYGPDDYDDEDDVARFVLTPEEYEATNCQTRYTPNTETVFTQGYYLTARPGTHHIIVYRGDTSFRDITDGQIATNEQRGADLAFMVGAQSGLGADGLVLDTRTTEEEYQGWAGEVPAHRPICYEAHYVNVQEEPILRESWVRFNLIPGDDVTARVEPIFFLGGLGMNIPPGAHQIVKGNCTLEHDEPVRIMGLTGHMHAAGERQTVWKTDNEGNREKIYETFDWEEPINAEYNMVHTNPEFNEEAKRDGAVSGPLWVQPGETIDWECEFLNRTTDINLRFGNGAYDAEMCNVFGFFGPGFADGPWRCINF